jgi:beta-lactamase regulating signal transducer with metallopeptidase domain
VNALLAIALANAAIAALLALFAVLADRGTGRPALAHALWLVVLVKLVTPPLFEVPLIPAGPVSSDHGGAAYPGAASVQAAARPPEAGSEAVAGTSPAAAPGTAGRGDGTIPVVMDAEPILLTTWLAGAILLLGVAVWRAARFAITLRAQADVDEGLQRRIDRVARRQGIKSAPRGAVVQGRVSPMIWFVPGAAPRLVVPRPLLGVLDDDQLDAVIAHELSHLERRDHWVRYLELIVGALYWWYPLVWWARKRLRAAEERACDQAVLRARPGAERSYAEGLLSTLEFVSGRSGPAPGIATGLGNRDQIERRLTMIMTGRPAGRLRRWQLFAMSLAAGVALALFPVRAGQAEEDAAAGAQDRERIELERRALEIEQELRALEMERMELEREAHERRVAAEAGAMAREAERLEREGRAEAARALKAEAAMLREQAAREAETMAESAEMRRRAMELQAKMERLVQQAAESEAAGDVGKATQIRAEQEQLGRELAREAAEQQRRMKAMQQELMAGHEQVEMRVLADRIRARIVEEERRHEEVMRELRAELARIESGAGEVERR